MASNQAPENETKAILANCNTRIFLNTELQQSAAVRAHLLAKALAELEPDPDGKNFVLVDYGRRKQLFIDRVVQVDALSGRYMFAQLLPDDEPALAGAVRLTQEDAKLFKYRSVVHNNWHVDVVSIGDFLRHALARQQELRDHSSPGPLPGADATAVSTDMDTLHSLERAEALVALVRQEQPSLPEPSSERLGAIAKLDARCFAQWGAGLDQEQVAMLCDTDIDHIERALDDWEARLDIQVDDIAGLFGARIGRTPGP